MRRVGFVDDYLENFHANIYLKLLRGPLARRGFVVSGATALQAEAGRQWAQKNDVPYFDTVAELNAEVDFFLILAPASPDRHLGMCQQVFPCQKTTFVDKTFAPDLATARQIFELADRHQVAIQSTSALRTTNVQAHVRQLGSPPVGMVVWAGGSSWDEYGIHPVELAISCMGPEVRAVDRFGRGDHPVLVLQFAKERTAVIDFNPECYVPFQAAVTTARETTFLSVDDNKLFEDAAGAILDFFEAGRPLIDRAETMAVREVLDWTAAKMQP